jgi:hypothetical protein
VLYYKISNVTSTSIQISIAATSQSHVFIGIYYAIQNTSSSWTPSETITASTIIQQGRRYDGRTANKQVVLLGLIPATSYFIAYVTVSAISNQIEMDDQAILQTVRNVSTLCCREADVSINNNMIWKGQVILSWLTIKLQVTPQYPLMMGLNVSYCGNGSTTSSLTSSCSPLKDNVIKVVFLPSSFYVSSTSIPRLKTIGNTLSMNTSTLPIGVYKISIDLIQFNQISGFINGVSNNSLHYATTYEQQTVSGIGNIQQYLSFTIKDVGDSLSAPQLLQAIYGDDGSYFTIVFDKPTDQGGIYVDQFICNLQFNFTCAAISSCTWIDTMTVKVQVTGNDGCALPDSLVFVNPTAMIHAACPYAGSGSLSCQNMQSWATVNSSQRIPIQYPANAIIPTTIISAPTIIGNCSALQLDLSASIGNGGRGWIVQNVTVYSEDHSSAKQFQQLMLSKTFKWFPPSSVPSSLLSADTSYIFNVSLCN